MEIISTKKLTKKKSCSEKLSKYVAAFDYIDKILIVLSARGGGGFCIISSISVVGEVLTNSRRKFYSNFFFNNRNNQEITEFNKKQEDKAW